VKITHDAWESMLRVRDLEYPDLRVLGWFHSHAGWGVFLSDPDVFIHRHFFPRKIADLLLTAIVEKKKILKTEPGNGLVITV
jgi:proteasome lid subunit RPN8/RPN11